MQAFVPVAAWLQPMSPLASAGRAALIATVTDCIAGLGLGPGRLRVAAVAAIVLNYLILPLASLAELARVTRPGGQPNPAAP